ncbi:hypothetical protein [Tenacibaculum maritimum]|nr:hypothetical protein [Tenacibaculum maritimum]
MGRQLYINHDKRVARAREAKLKQRLIAFLKEKDPNQTQIEKQANQLLGN